MMTNDQGSTEFHENGHVYTNAAGTTIRYDTDEPVALTTSSGDTCQLTGEGEVWIPANEDDQYTMLQANGQTISAYQDDGLLSTATAANRVQDEKLNNAIVDDGYIVNTVGEYNPATHLMQALSEKTQYVPSDAQALHGEVLKKSGVTCEKDGQPSAPVLDPEDIQNLAIGNLGEKADQQRTR